MVVNHLYIIVLLLAHVKAFENIAFCQEMVIKHCTTALGDVLQSSEEGTEPHQKFEKCLELQEAVTCLSVPRCSGDLLLSFRSLMLTTASLLKANKFCPNLKYDDLKKYITGGSLSCSGNITVYDQCDQHCMCYKGELLFCRRIRKDFTTMNTEERQRFVKALRTAATNPIYRDKYRNLGRLHSRIPSQLLHHMLQIFLPWHRWYLLEFENFLRLIDCRVTIPYWDWSKDAEHWTRATDESDVWNAGLHGLGGDGVLANGCVKDGPFKEGDFFVPETIGESCLKRNFNRSYSLPSKEQVQNIIHRENFTEFESCIRTVIHPAFHDCVGGHMMKHHSAAFAPEFWIHHSFVNKLWADWQIKSSDRTFEYFTSVSFEMPLTGRFPWELLDNHGLPGDVRVSYEHPQDADHN